MKVIFFTSDEDLSKITNNINGCYVTVDETDIDKLKVKGEILLFFHWDSFKESAGEVFDKLRQISQLKIVLMSDKWKIRHFMEHQGKENRADGYMQGPWNLKMITGIIDDFSLSRKNNETQEYMDDLTYVGVTNIKIQK